MAIGDEKTCTLSGDVRTERYTYVRVYTGFFCRWPPSSLHTPLYSSARLSVIVEKKKTETLSTRCKIN